MPKPGDQILTATAPEVTPAPVPEEAPQMSLEDQVVMEFDKNGSVNKTAQACGITWKAAHEILIKAGKATKPRNWSNKSQEQAPESESLTYQGRIEQDLFEAQRALEFLGQIKNIYGDETPELEKAIFDTYEKRRRA
jgi:hypothetical protein